MRRLGVEAVLVATAILVYFGVRGVTAVDAVGAHENAARIVELESRLGLLVEDRIQELVSVSQAAVMAMNWVYIWGHWPVIVTILVWLFVSRPDAYREIRAAMVLSGAVGLVIFAGFPVAPPRLADPQIVDTVTEYSTSYRVLQPPALVNQYAAMPSLHVGWDLLMGVAMVTYGRQVAVRAVGFVLPSAMLVSVLVTGNHYLLDAVAGIALVLASLAVARVVQR
ncbi:MAG: phosphatase PAP2 family protein, partial [Actinomycetes bacterium]